LPAGFIPDEDQGILGIAVQLPPGASIERTSAMAAKVEEILAKTEGVDAYQTIGGYGAVTSTYQPNFGTIFMRLKPWEERKGDALHARGIMRTLQGQLAKIPEAKWDEWRAIFRGLLPPTGDARYVTDKNPWNFDSIGIIARLFPGARIIHVRRNPVETGFSIWRNEFAKLVRFTHDLVDVGHYYGEYARVMAHWERIAGDVFTTIQTDAGAAQVAQEYRSSEFFVRASASRPATRPEGDRLSRIRQQSVLSQLVTLGTRVSASIRTEATTLPAFGSIATFSVKATSAEVNGVPSDHCTPLRKCRVWVSPSGLESQRSATQGSTSKVALLTRTSRA
jgi:hypothetical protein